MIISLNIFLTSVWFFSLHVHHLEVALKCIIPKPSLFFKYMMHCKGKSPGKEPEDLLLALALQELNVWPCTGYWFFSLWLKFPYFLNEGYVQSLRYLTVKKLYATNVFGSFIYHTCIFHFFNYIVVSVYEGYSVLQTLFHVCVTGHISMATFNKHSVNSTHHLGRFSAKEWCNKGLTK